MTDNPWINVLRLLPKTKSIFIHCCKSISSSAQSLVKENSNLRSFLELLEGGFMNFTSCKMKVSVVIPMYNSSRTIVRTLDSVISQTYQDNLEIIVVNDGSEDDSRQIVERYITNSSSPRKIKLLNKKNGGVSSARNMGIREAQGEWVAFLDADDVWFPEKLEKQFQAICDNPDIKFIGSNVVGYNYPYFGKTKSKIFRLSVREFIFKWYPMTPTIMVCKEILDKTGSFDEARTHAEDGDLWLRMAQVCDLCVLNEDLVEAGGGKRSFGESGLSANLSQMFNGEMHILRRAMKRKQINHLEYIFFYIWLTLKYLRRILITLLSGKARAHVGKRADN